MDDLNDKERAAADKIVEVLKPLPPKDREWVMRQLQQRHPELGRQPDTLSVNDTKLVDFHTQDGTLVDRMESLKTIVGELPKETQRGFYEEAKRTLEQRIADTNIELGAATEIRDGLEKQLAEANAAPATPAFPSLHGPTLRQMAFVAEQLRAGHKGTAWPHIDACLFDWHRAGLPTFELTGGLAAALMMTDCRGLLGRDFRVPFAGFAVQLPSPGPILLPAGEARWMLIHRTESTLRTTTYASGPDLTVSEETIPADDASLDAWIRGSSLERELRFIVNLCVYINSLHALPQPEGRRKPGGGGRKKRDSEPSVPQRWVLGREIKLSPGMMQAARSVAIGTATRKQRDAYRMHARFMVRGHWRNQAFGKQHAERRLRWIEPFWKGPEMADGLARLYAVAERETE